MTKTIHEKPCPQCGGQVIGRSDKIFCEVKCKNHHHMHSRNQNKPMTSFTNLRLLRNLTVLQGLLGPNGKKVRIHKSELHKRGFNFGACTSAKKVHGEVEYELYHMRYTFDRDGLVTVIQMTNLDKYLPGFFKRWEQEFPQGYVCPDEAKKRLKSAKIQQRE